MFTSILFAHLSFLRVNVKRGLLLLFAFHLLTTAAAAQSDRDIQLLERDKPVERELAGGQSHSYRIALTAGQYLRVIVDQRGIDVVVMLIAPDGKQLIEVDSPNGDKGPEPVAAIIESSGSHRLEIRALNKEAATGRYEVKIEELRIATEQDRNRIAAYEALKQAGALTIKRTPESLQAAIKKYEDALILLRAAPDRRNVARTLRSIGGGDIILGNKQKALEYFKQALPISKELRDQRNEAITLANIGSMHSELGERQIALQYFQEALPLTRALKDGRNEAVVLNNIGFIYAASGDKRNALEYYQQALEITKTLQSPRNEASVLNNIGGIYDDLGNGEEALKYFNQALSIFRTIRDRANETLMLNNIGGVYTDLGDYEKALEHLQQALVLNETVVDKRGHAATLHNIGFTYQRSGDNTKALDYYTRAIPFRKAAGDRNGEAWTLNAIGAVLYNLGDEQKELESYKQALQLWRQVGESRGETITQSNLMRAYQRLTMPQLGIFYGKSAVNKYQQLRSNIGTFDKQIQKTFLKSIEHTYRGLAELLIEQDRLAEAQQILNSFKDQQFFDFERTQQKTESALTYTAREENYLARFNKFVSKAGEGFENRPATASDEFSELLKQAESEFSKAGNEKDQVDRVSDTTQMQTALYQLTKDTGKTVVAVYTLVGQEKFHALIVTPEGITSVSSVAKGAELNDKARQLWGLLQSDAYDPRVLSHELYNVIFKPIKEKLPPETKTILWSLDGNLRYLPMGVLYDGKQYLVERYNHVNFTRADSERMTRAPSRQWTGLGLGSSQGHTVELLGSRHNFDELPGVAAELRAVFRGPGRAGGVLEGEVLPDDKFTKSAMLAGLARRRPVVHIASHFSFRPGDETRSFLLLGDGSVLTLAEMKTQRDLFGGVELLTLSACNTAAQQADADGREIDAFAELAQRLGANAVMATLWPLADESAPWLMQEFYRQRQAGAGMMKAEALRKAQLALLGGSARISTANKARQAGPDRARVMVRAGSQRGQSQTRADIIYIETKDAPPYKREQQKPFAHPYYWAPVILIGNLR